APAGLTDWNAGKIVRGDMQVAAGRRAGGLRFTAAPFDDGRPVALELQNAKYRPTDASARCHHALRPAKRGGRALPARETHVAPAPYVDPALAGRARCCGRARRARRDLPAHALARTCAPVAACGASLVARDPRSQS